MASQVPNATRSAAADAAVNRLDGGAGAGTVQIRTGSQPADPDDAATGTLLCTITLNDPAFGAAVDGVKTADVTPALTAAAVATGTAGWYRGLDSNAASVIDGAVSASGGGGEMQLNTTALVSGVDVTILSWVVTMPAA
jgi:hypothetical protein